MNNMIPAKSDISRLCAAAADGDDATVRQWIETYGKAHVDAKNFYGWTALMAAAREGRQSTVQLLLSAGAKTDIQDDHGHDAAYYARKMNYSETAAMIDSYTETQRILQKQEADAAARERTKQVQEQLRKNAPGFKLGK